MSWWLFAVEKRVGILKPQGSLERNRESNPVNTDASSMELNSSSCARKPRQNVAMQAIMRRAETEQKQVTFKNVSPMIIEELDSSRNEGTPVSTVKSVGTKNVQNHSQIPIQNGGAASAVGAHQQNVRNVQKRGPVVSSVPTSVQNHQPSSVIPLITTQVPPMKLQSSLPQAQPPAPSHQFSSGEQQTPTRSQFGHQPPLNLSSNCNYHGQSFNVQNPQFTKNFVTNHVSNIPPQQYQLSGQYNACGVTLPAQCTGNIQQNVQHQQRLAQQAQMLPQGGLSGAAAQTAIEANLSQALGLQHQQQPFQNVATGLPQNMGIQQQPQQQQQQQGNGLAIHRQNLVPNNLRTNQMNIQNQMSIAGPSSMLNNVQAIPPGILSGYQKNLQQPPPALQNLVNPPISPTGISGLRLSFNPNVGHSVYNQTGQKQISPSAYAKNSNQFVFPNQTVVNKSQHPINNYTMFHNYDANDFNLWGKDTQQQQQSQQQPPQPPVAWWGGSAGNQTPMQPKETTPSDAFQNWANSPSAGNTMIGRTPLTPGNNYHQNPLLGKQYDPRNSFEEARQFEVSNSFVFSTFIILGN